MTEPVRDSLPAKGVTRRQFLRAATAGVAGVVAAKTGIDFLVRVFGPEFKRMSAVDQVRKFEAHVGDRPLTFEEARAFVPLVANLFTASRPTKRSAEDLAANTFLIQIKYEYPEPAPQLFFADGTPAVNDYQRRFLEDYPGNSVSSTTLTLVDMQRWMYRYFLGGNTEDDRVFSIFERLNDPFVDYRPGMPRVPTMQYKAMDYTTECKPSTPVVRFREHFLHEFVHADNTTADKELPPDLFRIFQQKALSEVKNITWIKHEGFGIHVKSPDYLLLLNFSYFDEFVTEYNANKIAIENGLPFESSYTFKPSDFKNFEKVLQQAGISDVELFKMQSEEDLESLFIKMAKGAKNITFQSREEEVKFSFEHFFLRKNNDVFIDWTSLKPHFPEIDTAQYNYTPLRPSGPKGPIQGCFIH